MITLRQMAEAHLANVHQELQGMIQRRNQLEEEIKKTKDYFEQGLSVLNPPQSGMSKVEEPDTTS